MDFVWVAVGGALGAVCRYALGIAITDRFGADFPIHTTSSPTVSIARGDLELPAYLEGTWAGGPPGSSHRWLNGTA